MRRGAAEPVKKKKPNPRNRPATAADVERAKKSAHILALKQMIYLFLYILIDKHDAKRQDLKVLAGEINYYAESISEGRITWKDIERVVRDEYEIELPW
jgi:hypothetical protein